MVLDRVVGPLADRAMEKDEEWNAAMPQQSDQTDGADKDKRDSAPWRPSGEDVISNAIAVQTQRDATCEEPEVHIARECPVRMEPGRDERRTDVIVRRVRGVIDGPIGEFIGRIPSVGTGR